MGSRSRELPFKFEYALRLIATLLTQPNTSCNSALASR